MNLTGRRIVFDELTRDEKLLRKYVRTRLERGQDLPPGLIRAVDLFAKQAEEAPEIYSLDEIDKLSHDERRIVLARIERDAGLEPFVAADFRAAPPLRSSPHGSPRLNGHRPPARHSGSATP
jgi:hypothetical protein